jgi:hypothetical protein
MKKLNETTIPAVQRWHEYQCRRSFSVPTLSMRTCHIFWSTTVPGHRLCHVSFLPSNNPQEMELILLPTSHSTETWNSFGGIFSGKI